MIGTLAVVSELSVTNNNVDRAGLSLLPKQSSLTASSLELLWSLFPYNKWSIVIPPIKVATEVSLTKLTNTFNKLEVSKPKLNTLTPLKVVLAHSMLERLFAL